MFLHVLFLRGCKISQFYGYTREGDGHGVFYDADWKDHTYFISSQETGFELSILRKFDVELLIGQLSYKQKALIYNITNGYDDTKKESVTQKESGSSSTSEACRYANNCVPVCKYSCMCIFLRKLAVYKATSL